MDCTCVTSGSVLVVLGRKCTLAASRVAPGEPRCGTDRGTDGRTPDRYITLSARRGQRNNKLGLYRPCCID